MTRAMLVTLCCLTAPAWAQSPRAERVGPATPDGASRPLVVEVQAAETAAESAAVNARRAAPAAPRQLDGRQQLAKARMEAAERQLQRLSQFNLQAQPAAAVFYSSRVLPYTQVRPRLIPDPVEVVVPSSPFSNVLLKAEQTRQQAELEMQADTPPGLKRLRTLEQVEADLRRNEFIQQSASIRLDQLQATSYLSYAQIWHNLGDKIQLEIKEAQLREEELLEERQNLTRDSQPAPK